MERVSSKNNLLLLKYGKRNNKNSEVVLIMDGFKLKKVLMESEIPIKHIRAFEYEPEEGQESKFCAIYLIPRNINGIYPQIVTWFDGKEVNRILVDSYDMKLLSSKIQDSYQTILHIVASGTSFGLKITRFKCPEKFNIVRNSVEVEPFITHYDVINMGGILEPES